MESRRGIGGPKTPQGKRRSSLNALKHGIYAKTPKALERVEKQVGFTYQQLLSRMSESFKPTDTIEDLLVSRIARLAWALLCVQVMENRNTRKKGLSLGRANRSGRFLRHERLTGIRIHRAIVALNKRRKSKRKTGANELVLPSVSHAQAG